jgi:hypothetical protein
MLTIRQPSHNLLHQLYKVKLVCEESGPISLSYNVLLTTIVKPLVLTVTIKSTLTCTNCG